MGFKLTSRLAVLLGPRTKRPPAVRPAGGQNALLTRHALGGDGPVLSWLISDPASGGGQRRIGQHQPSARTICAEGTGGHSFLGPQGLLMTIHVPCHVRRML